MKRYRKLCLSMVAVIAVAFSSLAVAACGSSDSGSGSDKGGSGDATKVAWLYTAPRDDKGFNSAHAMAEDSIGKDGRFEMVSADNLPYTDQTTQIATQFVAQGAKVLVDTSGFGSLVTKVCEQNPSITCIQVSPQEKLPDNMVGWTYQFPYLEYVGGYAAGLTTKTDTVGYIVPSDSPRVNSAVNGFALGCKASNPDCVVRTVTINTFYDPPKENQAANTLADANADVITAFVNGQSFCGAAEKRGIRAIGIFTDALGQCPKSTVTSLVTDYEPFYRKQLDSIADGSFKGQQLVYMPPKHLGLGEWGPDLPKDVQVETEKQLDALHSGKLQPFAGPIKDQSGKVRVPEGKTLSNEFLYSDWDWYVENVK